MVSLHLEYLQNDYITERQNIENERQRKMAELANRGPDGNPITLRSVSAFTLFNNYALKRSYNELENMQLPTKEGKK